MKQVGIVGKCVMLVDSVNGDGSSVKALASQILKEVSLLPMMKEQIPKKWIQVRHLIKVNDPEIPGPLSGLSVLMKDEVLQRLWTPRLALTKEQLWEALEFLGLLGDAMVHRDAFVPDIQQFIALMRPLLHHSLKTSLNRLRASGIGGSNIDFDTIVVPRFAELGREKQAEIEEYIARLEDQQVLCTEVLKYMSSWEDIKTETQRQGGIRILEACHLLVSLPTDVLSKSEESTGRWLVTSRLSHAPQNPNLDPFELLCGRSGESLMFRASASFIPHGFFSALLASQLASSDRLKIRKISKDSSNMDIEFKSLFGKDWEHLVMRQTDSKDPLTHFSDGRVLIEVWSTSAAMIKRVAFEMDNLKRQKFPGIALKYSVYFFNDEFSKNSVLEWDIESRFGSISTVLEQREMENPISVKVWNQAASTMQMTVGDAIQGISQNAAFFLSHAWKDLSMHSDSNVTVVEGLRILFEEKSAELVWLDTKEMAFEIETQFHRRMEKGIRCSSCFVSCLSHLYLTRPNCLLELAWAVQDYVVNGKPIILVSVDPQLTFDSVQAWNTAQDLPVPVTPAGEKPAKIDKRTLEFFLKYLKGVRIFDQWKDGEGARNAKREKAVDEMLNSLRRWNREGPQEAPKANLKFEVRQEAGQWYICEL